MLVLLLVLLLMLILLHDVLTVTPLQSAPMVPTW